MGFIKYSIGGKIKETTANDKLSSEKIEENEDVGAGSLIICRGCKIQHLLAVDEKERKCSCGNIVRFN